MPTATSGSEREVLVREFLAKVFPSGLRFGCGAITDKAQERSGQLDVVVEYPVLPSFPLPQGSDRLYLAESVAVVFSVKSDLSSQWAQVQSEVEALRRVKRRWKGATYSSGSSISFSGPTEDTIPIIAVGYVGYKSPDALAKRMESTPEELRPNAALVIESGAFVGFGFTGDGAAGFYLATVHTAYAIRRLVSVDPELLSYVI
jgi:hypothetical protein